MAYSDRMPATGERRRPGPPARFSREQLVEAAIEVVDTEGFDSLSLRAVARRLGVTPMALYTYVRSSDELVTLVVERLVELKARDVVFPSDWKGALRAFATNLAELVVEHPAMLGAYAAGVVNTGQAMRVADDVLGRLLDDGLSAEEALQAYLGVHMLVLGYVVLVQRSGREARPLSIQDLSSYPAIGATAETLERLAASDPLGGLVDLVIAGVEARQAARLRRRRSR